MAARIPIFGFECPQEADLCLAEVVSLTKQTVLENLHSEPWRRRLVAALVVSGRFLAENNRPIEALDRMRDALMLLDQLYTPYPDNDLRKALALGYRDVGVFCSRMGRWVDARHCSGRCAPLLPPYTGSMLRGVVIHDRLAIAGRLLKDDPRHPGWKLYSQGLSGNGYYSSGYGNIKLNVSPPSDGLEVYMKDLIRFEGMPAAKLNHPFCRSDLSLLHERIGDLHAARSQPVEALAAFEACRSVREGLVREDPDHCGWQRDFVVIEAKIGLQARRAGKKALARQAFVAGRSIVSSLMANDPALVSWGEDLNWFDDQLTKFGHSEVA